MQLRPVNVMLAGGGAAVGFGVGALVARTVTSSDWFEAVGTWIGVFVAATAAVLALQAYRKEEQARRAAEREVIQRAQVLADQVLCVIDPVVTFEAGSGEDEATYAGSFRFRVVNRMVDHAITDVRVRTPQLFWPENESTSTQLAEVVAPGQPWVGREFQPEIPFLLSPDRVELKGLAVFRFRLDGVQWEQRSGFPSVRVS